MSEILDMLEKMREQRGRTQGRIQAVTEEDMLAPTTYGDREVNVRFMFYRLIAHEVEHTVQLAKTMHALGIAQGEAGLILKKLQAARGELEGMLVGMESEDLDRTPVEGEWSLRQVLDHILSTEEFYSKRIEDALQT